ncbi:microtubule-associated protein RP/EB family member 1-like [Octopus vulgaris]|uniref:Microtubule-associated protein RP/EB family member 1-like n=1 Tax=Octopus vulgaris TaxID=6645 RepID=A0AA36AXR3_OCTVU|nr:microtubule-associated protein RP/EB family member 1-like [Octopus vulgaris]
MRGGNFSQTQMITEAFSSIQIPKKRQVFVLNGEGSPILLDESFADSREMKQTLDQSVSNWSKLVLVFSLCLICDMSLVYLRFGKNLSVSSRHNNFKRLQSAFNTVGVEKNFPMENMMRGNFQANYYFGQWFKGFFEANYSGEPYDVNKLRQMCCNRAASKDRFTKDIRGGECRLAAEAKRMPKYIKQRAAIISPTTSSPPPQSPHHTSNSPPPSRLQSAVSILTKANLVDTLSQTDETYCGILNSIYSFEQEADEQKELRSDLLREKAELEQAVRELQKEKEKLSTNYEHSNREKSASG